MVSVLALIDCAHDEQFFPSTYRHPAIQRSLYEDTPLAGLGKAAPHLLLAPVQGDGALTWLKELFFLCGNFDQLPLGEAACADLVEQASLMQFWPPSMKTSRTCCAGLARRYATRARQVALKSRLPIAWKRHVTVTI